MAPSDWLRAILEQGQANKNAGYAPWKPSQVLMDWLRKRITQQEETKMKILNEPKETEAS